MDRRHKVKSAFSPNILCDILNFELERSIDPLRMLLLIVKEYDHTATHMSNQKEKDNCWQEERALLIKTIFVMQDVPSAFQDF